MSVWYYKCSSLCISCSFIQYYISTMSVSENILKSLKNDLEPLGMEIYLFKASWYNSQVASGFCLPVPDDTLCAVILTIPSFFEKAFLPFLRSSCTSEKDFTQDPIDRCIAFHVQHTIAKLEISTSVMYDYDMFPNRKPKVLVQTAAHVSGAAFYYQRKHVTPESGKYFPAVSNTERSSIKEKYVHQCESHSSLHRASRGVPPCKDVASFSNPSLHQREPSGVHIELKDVKDKGCDTDTTDLSNFEKNSSGTLDCKSFSSISKACDENYNAEVASDPWDISHKIFGVCIHPKYGGWFAIRCVVVFDQVSVCDLPYIVPEDSVPCRESRIDLLNRFNGNWKDWTYRDIIPVVERYSEKQKLYFETLPKNRRELYDSLLR